MKIGDKVNYTDAGGKSKVGEIAGIRKIDTDQGAKVIGYVVNTGKVLYKDMITNEKGKKVAHEQHEVVDVEPADISPAK